MKVSIITATYNRAQYLPITIESVLAQTYSDFEYHIVDDGSTDNTRKAIKPFLSDRRLFYDYQENRGQSSARNKGLFHATGDYICFLDSDNLWFPNKLASQLEVFKRMPDVDIVYSNGECIDELGNPVPGYKMKRYSGYITRELLKDNFVGFNSAMSKRECFARLGGLDETLQRSDDYELWLRFSTQFKFYYHPETLIKYRVWKDQLSSNKEARFEAIQQILSRFLIQYPAYATEEILKDTWIFFYTRRGRHRAAVGLFARALSDYFKAMSYGFLRIEPWRALARLILLWK